MNIKINDIIILKPKTRHARNRVREHGANTKVIHLKTGQFCVTHLDGDSWRWVEIQNDEHFELEHHHRQEPQHFIDDIQGDDERMSQKDLEQWDMYQDPDLNWSGTR